MNNILFQQYTHQIVDFGQVYGHQMMVVRIGRELNANVQWSSVSISSSGEYGLIFVSGFNGHSRENRGIWVSSDCSTFNKKIYLSSGDYHNDVDISEDGKCMVVASKDLGVYVSLDYGEN